MTRPFIQSIPSSKTEPFKLRLTKSCYEQVREIEDRQLLWVRVQDTYRSKGLAVQAVLCYKGMVTLGVV